MEKVYLKSGQEAYLNKKLDDNNYIVAPVMFYQGYDDEPYEDVGDVIVVSEIFKSAPIEKIQKDYIDILDKIKIKNEALRAIEIELSTATNELRKIEVRKTDVGKLIYDRSELKTAERITVFKKDSIVPEDMSEKLKRELKISIEFSVINGQEKCWSSRFYGDTWGSSNYLDPDYGFMIDATDEEILIKAKERVVSKPTDYFSRYQLEGTHDDYLTDDLIKKKREFEEENKKKNIEKLNQDITKAQELLAELNKIKNS